MNKFYGNENVLAAIGSMLKSGRIPHSFLFFGERGLGKKALANRLASELVGSENTMQNPDVIWAKHEGKLGGFKAEYVRGLLVDAFIAPNNSDRKVYIFTDCDNMNAAAQNALLKVVEEPPDFTFFIFTVSAKSSILPTILSRVISLGLSECSEKECSEALSAAGNEPEKIKDAITAFHGNIGMCSEYLSDDGTLRECVDTVRNITNAIAGGNEYALLKALTAADTERSVLRYTLSMLERVIRDAAVMRCGVSSISCCPDEAKKLGAKLSPRKLEAVHEILRDTINDLDTNVAPGIELASLCGQIFNI